MCCRTLVDVDRAEKTLGTGAVEISSSGVILLTNKQKTGTDEDSNAVYNRICTTLQSLIDEAQSALQKPGTPTSPTNPIKGQGSRAGSPVLPSKRREEYTPLRPLSSVRTGASNNLGLRTPPPMPSPTNTVPRNTRDTFPRFDNGDHERIFRPSVYDSFETDDPLSLYNPWESTYAGTSEVSRIYWRQKHEEQHDRYRKSCQRVTLELEQRFYNNSTDSDDSEAPSERSTVSTTLSAIGLGSSSLAKDSRPLHRSASSQSLPLRSSLRKSGSKSERLKKKYQVQFLNLQPLDLMESSTTPASTTTSTSKSASASVTSSSTSTSSKQDDQYELAPRCRDHQIQRSVKHQSVGSNRSRSVALQLYDLWQQTWLRTRIMHVIAGSVEVIIIIWVVIRASRATLTWFGIQPKTFTEWLSFAYNRRWRITGGSSSSSASSAKDIYNKIRKDGIRLRQVNLWNQGEPEALVEDMVAGMTAGSSSGLTPSNVIYGPAKKVLVHAATGVLLACLSDGARRLTRKL